MIDNTPLNIHLIPGVSASGKTTMSRYAAQQFCNDGVRAEHIVPHTTRQPRPHELQGVDYYFHDLESFQKSHPIIDGGVTWRYSKINGHYYFNNDADTLPNRNVPIKILPVAYSSLAEVVNDYSNLQNTAITVLPIVITKDIQNRWLKIATELRPDRNLAMELDAQEIALSSVSHLITGCFKPRWESKQVDLDNFYRQLKLMTNISRLAIRRAL